MGIDANRVVLAGVERKDKSTSWVSAYTKHGRCRNAKVFTERLLPLLHANFMIGFDLSSSGTLITIDYMNRSNQQAHEWWKESLDDNQRQMRLSSVRAGLRHQYAVAWRRNLIRLGIVVAVPIALRLVAVL